MWAVNVRANVPGAVGVPDSTPVAALNVTPEGSEPDSVSVGAGDPESVTVNHPAAPTVKAALFALVIVGADVWGVDDPQSATKRVVTMTPKIKN